MARYIPLVLIILLMALPAIQMRFRLFPEKPLSGAFILAKPADFSKAAWDSGEYQQQVEKYLKDHAGFRNFLVRLYNQLDYSLFSKANAEGVTIGKNRQLYEYDYIRSWLGADYPGDSFIRKKLGRVRYVQEFLKREKGIDLIVVFEPGKASFYPEHIPEKYTGLKAGPSTYELYVGRAKEMGLEFVDFQEYFMQLKAESPFPLFPKYGTHWSEYGAVLAADSLIRFIERIRGINLAEVETRDVEISKRPRKTDDDVAKTMNLLIPPISEKLAYPILDFDTTGKSDEPMVLVVADSYYWNIFNTRIPRHLFANETFWYFNALVYPDYYYQPVRTGDLDLRSEVEKQDVIFLMVTERFVHKFDWTFIDQLFSLYAPDWLEDPVYNRINSVMANDPWYREVMDKARKKNISLEEALVLEAKYTFFKEDTAGYLIRFGEEHYTNMISSLPEWMAGVRDRAAKRGISVDEMLALEALYTFRQNYPGLYDANRGIYGTLDRMAGDPMALDSLRRQAAYYHFDEPELLWINAFRSYREGEIRRISTVIRNDNDWLARVHEKAANRSISPEEMIRLDAIWVFENQLKAF